jgi:hypothetical protein
VGPQALRRSWRRGSSRSPGSRRTSIPPDGLPAGLPAHRLPPEGAVPAPVVAGGEPDPLQRRLQGQRPRPAEARPDHFHPRRLLVALPFPRSISLPPPRPVVSASGRYRFPKQTRTPPTGTSPADLPAVFTARIRRRGSRRGASLSAHVPPRVPHFGARFAMRRLNILKL